MHVRYAHFCHAEFGSFWLSGWFGYGWNRVDHGAKDDFGWRALFLQDDGLVTKSKKSGKISKSSIAKGSFVSYRDNNNNLGHLGGPGSGSIFHPGTQRRTINHPIPYPRIVDDFISCPPTSIAANTNTNCVWTKYYQVLSLTVERWRRARAKMLDFVPRKNSCQ